MLLFEYIVINALVLFNSLFHDPTVGYDAYAHINYIQVLRQLRLPTPADTHEFFSPPLSYAMAALFNNVKAAQLLNFVYSLILTWFLIKLIRLVSNNSKRAAALGLLILGMLPVYYKSFSMIRPEPMLAMLVVVLTYQVTKVLIVKLDKSEWQINTLINGFLVGAILLTRQWGVFVLAAVGIVSLVKKSKSLLASLIIGTIIGGWFYGYLFNTYGSITAFNRGGRASFSFKNEPPSFYFGKGDGLLFKDPVVKIAPETCFGNQFFPVLYSDIWGDYQQYFLIYGFDTGSKEYIAGDRFTRQLTYQRPHNLETNYGKINQYLGRVNLVSLLPTILIILSLGFSLIYYRKRKQVLWPMLTVLITAMGYMYFVIMTPTPNDDGDTIKAVYILQMFPFLALYTGLFLDKVFTKFKTLGWILVGGLIIIFGYNFPTYISHYLPQNLRQFFRF